MTSTAHSSLSGVNLHVPGYRQDADPGAVGAGKYWIDSSAGTGSWTLKVRNAADTGWESIVSSGVPDHNHTTGAGDGGDLDAARVGDYLELTEVAAPGTPAAGLVRVYAKADGSVYQKDDAGTETGLAGGGGGGGAPTDAEYVVETANGTLSGESVLGTTVVTTAAYASRQAAARAGRLFLPNDGVGIERDTGAAWAPWGPLFPLTAPVHGDFAWLNQGTATVTAGGGAIYLASPIEAAHAIRARIKTAPTPPYTITALILPHLKFANFNRCGLLFRQSSDGKIHSLSLYVNSSTFTLSSRKNTNETTFAIDYTTINIPPGLNWIFLRIADDNANRILSYSVDGRNFYQLHSIARTDFLTADQVGFFTDTNNSVLPAAMSLISWRES